MAVVKSSSTVVVFFSELMRRMSSANLRKERFVSGSCSAKLTPWLPLFHIFCSWFHVFLRKCVEQKRAGRVTLFGSLLHVEVFVCDVSVHCCSLLVVEL